MPAYVGSIAVIITPAVLATNKAEFESKRKLAESLSHRLQIDFMDGQFVLPKSLPVETMLSFGRREAVAHLMVSYPQKYLSLLKKKQFKEVIFHLEAKGVNNELVDKSINLSFVVALALNPGTSVQELEKFAPALKEGKVAEVLLLAVEPGYSGQKFKPQVLDKVDFIKSHYNVKISVDGGVNSQNIFLICQKPVSEVYVGSGLLEQKDPAAEYKKLILSCRKPHNFSESSSSWK